MNIELPEDADGREIPLDTEVPYDRHGFKNLATSGLGGSIFQRLADLSAKQAEDGDVQTGITCPNCGERIDFRAGYIDKGKVFICEKGRPLMREARYCCRHCDATVILLEKCEPKGVCHD